MTDIPTLDSYWEQLRGFLARHYGPTDRLVLPDPLDSLFPGAQIPLDARDPDVVAIAIHKGDYIAYDPDFLHHILMQGRPVFANEVFVVVALGGPDPDQPVNEDHVGALLDIRSWARRHASAATVATYPERHVEYAPADALAHMARLIVHDLVKPITGTPHKTVAETAKPFGGTRWFWGDDAAKVAELFCLPGLRAMAPDLADQLIDVILSLSPDSIIRRRIGPVALNVEKEEPRDFRVLTPFTITFGDMSRGEIRQAVRFNDGRSRPLVCHAPGMVAFIWRGERHQIDLADAICASRIAFDGNGVTLRYIASIRRPDDPRRELASVEGVWTLQPGRNALLFDMTLRPVAFVTLRDVTLTSAVRDLDTLGSFDRITSTTPGVEHSSDTAPRSSVEDRDTILPCPGITHFSIWESRSLPGHAVGLHFGPQSTAITRLRVHHSETGRMASVDAEYRCASVSSRRIFSVREARLLTAGGYYEKAVEYEALVREPEASRWCHDPSMTYDTGVELNAVATYLFFALRDRASPDILSDRLFVLRTWYDRHLALYIDHIRPGEPHQHERLFVRGLAFVILSLDVMERCFPNATYGKTTDLLTGLLRDTEVPAIGQPGAGLFSNGPASDPSRPELDSQGAALLALARRAFANGPDASLSAAIERGVMALRIAVPHAATYGNDPLDHETVVIGKDMADQELIDTGFWTYKLGLLLRAFAVIAAGGTQGCIHLSDDARRHMTRLEAAALGAVMRSTVCRAEGIEILTSHNAGETNSETQPWVAMGLVPSIEEELLSVPVMQREAFRFPA